MSYYVHGGTSQKTVMLVEERLWYTFGSWLMDSIPCSMSHDDDDDDDILIYN
jgi:hypothetical protein